MEDMTKPDLTPNVGAVYHADNGEVYHGDGTHWVLQDPGVVEDTLRGGAAGLGSGLHKALTFPGNLGELGLAGAQQLVGKDSVVGGDIQRLRDDYTYPYSTEGSKWLVDKKFPFTTYEPQHTLGNIAKTGGDILPSAALGVLGEGALGASYGPAAVRAGLSTVGGGVGGGLMHDNAPMLEGPAEAGGMMLGMGGPAMARGLLKPAKGGVIEKAKNFGGAVIPTALGGAAAAYLGPKLGNNPLASALEGGVSGYLGGGPVMKAGGELAGAVGKAVTPKAIPQTISAMTKALSKKSPYNTKGLDVATAAALLAGQGAPAGAAAVGPE